MTERKIEEMVEEIGAYPVFVRGTCVEEALWLLGFNRGVYESLPDVVYAFTVYEGFEKAGITPIKPVPQNYTLRRMRDEAIAWAHSSNEEKSSLYHFGDEKHARMFAEDKERLGVILYFNPEIIRAIEYRQDPYDKDRESELCAVEIPINDDFGPENICLVEPLGPTDHNILQRKKPKTKILPPLFNNWDQICSYLGENDEITSRGFEFPK